MLAQSINDSLSFPQKQDRLRLFLCCRLLRKENNIVLLKEIMLETIVNIKNGNPSLLKNYFYSSLSFSLSFP
jgi:hypothetical protein